MQPQDVSLLTINWKRCIHVDDVIDENLIKRLTPKILEFREESDLPITVAINSPGGSLAAVDTLVALLTGPNQDGKRLEIITVSVHKAYSAAANLLASGNYAVALPESEILFHDVRYGGIDDVTPSVAKTVASKLQDANEEFSIRLANNIFRRLVWNYVDLDPKFKIFQEKYPDTYSRYEKVINACQEGQSSANIDIASFITSLYALLSKASDSLVDNAMRRLYQWGIMTKLANSFPTYRVESDNKSIAGMLDGMKAMFEQLLEALDKKGNQLIWEQAVPKLKLYIPLIIDKLLEEDKEIGRDFYKILESANEDFRLVDSINDNEHATMATKQLLQHKGIFFSNEARAQLESGDESLKQAAIKEVFPDVKLLWHFCVLQCRELFTGEHRMSPRDAQILGLVDEVVGGGAIESLREYGIQKSKQEVKTT